MSEVYLIGESAVATSSYVMPCERGIRINETYKITAPPIFDMPQFFHEKIGHKRNYKYHK